MKILQIMPAIDWYFKHDLTVWNIAAFGLTDEGETIGLVGAGNDGTLKPVYLHRRQLTDEEISAADKKR
jgi:hypothetical protein